MRVLIVDYDSTGLDIAWRAAEAGHEVKWWLTPNIDHSPVRTGDGFPGIQKVSDWREHMKWAKDGIVLNLFNDRKITAELDKWKAFGYPVFGPTTKSAALEIDRGLGMKYFEEFGFEVPPYHTFDTIDQALAFAWKAQDPYVLKPMGDEPDKSLTYVSSSPADLVAFLELKKKRGPKIKGKLMLQEKVDLIMEIGISGWMGKDGFLAPKNLNVEHKKLMNDDYGPNCYPPDSEVLTRSGWKYWPDVTSNDEVCTLVDGRLKFEKPSQLVVGDFDGELIGWSSPYLDILVTPGHNMYVQDDHARKDFWFESAAVSENKKRNVLRGAGIWNVSDYLKGMPSFIHCDFSDWCEFVGIYIADGHTKKRSVVFGNCPPHKQELFRKATIKIGLQAHSYGRDLYVNGKQLADYFRTLGKAVDKRVPDYIKNSSSDAIRSFLRGFGYGDGCRRENYAVMTTISQGLADDIQEMALKAGWCASIRSRDRHDENHLINGAVCHNTHISYDIGLSKVRPKAEISPKNSYRKRYKGKVYCCTVASHVIYVRRNGKPCFLGQTGEQGTMCKYFTDTAESKLSDALVKFEEPLIKMGHTGDFDIGGAIDTKGRFVPFEVSARMGWPSTFILFHCHRGDPIEWMKEALNGVDVLEVDERAAIGVVMALPPYPEKNEHPANSVGNLVTGVEEVWEHISPVELMIETGPMMKNGKVTRGPVYKTTGDYICCVTAQGNDVHDAVAGAYSAAERVKYRDRMVRTDIGKGLEKKLSQAKALGFNELPDY